MNIPIGFKSVITALLIILAYFKPINVIIHIFVMFFVIDFVTGLMVSFKRGKRFKSSKARRSFAKLMCYTGSIAALLFIGKNLQAFEAGENDLIEFLWIIKMAVYTCVWFESKSVLENLCLLYPDNEYLKFLDYLIGVEFLQKIPPLSDFLKEEKEKQNQNNKNEAC